MTDSNFTIGFIGLGLIGGSIAKGIRRVFPNYTLIGMDENPDTIKSALEDGIIDSIATDCKTDFAECNYVFLCAPVQYNVMYLKDLKGSINENCILTDVGSVKEEIHLKIEELGMEEYFIGGHPMVGSEKAGFSFSSDRLVSLSLSCPWARSAVSEKNSSMSSSSALGEASYIKEALRYISLASSMSRNRTNSV